MNLWTDESAEISAFIPVNPREPVQTPNLRQSARNNKRTNHQNDKTI
ncbi:MAG: hypothetical protein M0R32_11750 [Candidatus Cloacimonetes bacterium]|nr:hypothetical protein [Candidatus Cloacimonadota bacterium]